MPLFFLLSSGVAIVPELVDATRRDCLDKDMRDLDFQNLGEFSPELPGALPLPLLLLILYL